MILTTGKCVRVSTEMFVELYISGKCENWIRKGRGIAKSAYDILL